LNLDNWVYLTSGLTAAKVTTPAHPEQPVVFLNRVDGRFRPGTDVLEPTAGTAQFGQTFDSFGRKFICSNRNHIQQVVMELEYLKRNPNLSFSSQVEDIPDHEAACRVYPLSHNITTAAFHTGFFTSACGVTIYNGTALPAQYRGNSFTCEPAGNLVHHDVLTQNGVTFVAKRAYPTNEFLASPDNWFRAVNLANGPDGALYVCDMYRKTIEHPEYLPEATRKVTDFESGKTMGRIYRIVGEEPKVRTLKSKVPGKFDLGKLSTKELVGQLENPSIWWRMTAQRLLLECQDPKAAPLLKTLCVKGNTPEARVHALRTLDGLNALGDQEIQAALKDPAAGVREHGLQLAEPRLARSSALASQSLALAADPDARVRFQCALSLGGLDNDRTVPALTKIVLASLDDKWTRAAALTAITHRERQFLKDVLTSVSSMPATAPGLPPLMAELGHILAATEPKEELAATLEKIVASKRGADLPWQMAAVGGFGDGLHARGIAAKEHSAVLALCEGSSSGLRPALDHLFQRSSKIAVDAGEPLPSRLAAISLLGQADFALAGQPLETLLGPQQPAEVQTAGIRALSQLSDTNVGAALVTRERWNGYTPAVRDAALSVLMASTNSLQALFAAIEKGDVAAYTVNADRRNQLMKHKDDALRERATALFKDLNPGDRMKVYEDCKSVLSLKPDSQNGHAVFQKNCIPCHTFSGEGHLVGPDLTGIRNQPSEVLLLHIVVPEYEINPIYTCYNLETKDGQSFTGLLVAETPAAITLRMAQSVEQQIRRSNIASMTTSRLSLMPQELEKAMTRQELADVVAFLKGI
jgi:putative heme-binding domain-containing protein